MFLTAEIRKGIFLFGMPVNYSMNLFSDNCTFEVYLNKDDKVFIGVSDPSSPGFVLLDKDDWEEMKLFVDGLFKSVEQNG